MKLILAAFVVFGSWLLFTAGSLGQKTTTTPTNVDNTENARFFFLNSDPCNNFIYRLLNISDAKCSLQCYLQGGLQQGGFCDANNVCQCNQITR